MTTFIKAVMKSATSLYMLSSCQWSKMVQAITLFERYFRYIKEFFRFLTAAKMGRYNDLI